MTANLRRFTAANMDSHLAAAKNLHSPPIQFAMFPKQLDSLLCKILFINDVRRSILWAKLSKVCQLKVRLQYHMDTSLLKYELELLYNRKNVGSCVIMLRRIAF